MTTYFVCDTSGQNTNTGTTEEFPFKTIQYAADIAQPGDTIMVQPGIYRERVSPPRGGSSNLAPITYKSVEPNKAILRGSIPWNPTKCLSPNIYFDILDANLFTDTSAVDGPNPFRVPFSVTPFGRNGNPEFCYGDKKADQYLSYNLGQVFVNDNMFRQCPFINEMLKTENSWFYDSSSNQLYVNLRKPIEKCNIEITNQRRLFAPHKRQLRYIIVDGFTIERCGNNYPNQFWTVPANQHAGMIGTRSGKYWTIQNNIIRYASGVGIDWGNEGNSSQDLETGSNGLASGSYGHKILNNKICDNGAAGTASYMGKNFICMGNRVERNNNLLFSGSRRWESAGIKVHCPTTSMITNNMVKNNYCNGIWSDQGAGKDSIFNDNIIINNTGNGLNFELGINTSGQVVNNIFDGNAYNLYFATSGGCLITHNLFLSSKKGDIYTGLFNRPDKWDSLNIEIYYNLFTNSPYYLSLTVPNAICSRFMNYNQYSSDNRLSIITDPKTRTTYSLEQWKNEWQNYNETNCDEMSVVSYVNTNFEIIAEGQENEEILLHINIDPFLFPYIKRLNNSYTLSDMWSKTNCFAGPFSTLVVGSQTINITHYNDQKS
jgi:hypothetical protein